MATTFVHSLCVWQLKYAQISLLIVEYYTNLATLKYFYYDIP